MQTKAKRDFTLWAVNASLVVTALVIIVGGWWLSEGRLAQVVGTENRFLTTEWYLLQELKAQTDQKLHEKDLEIDSLRRRYEGLKALNSSPDLLVKVEEELRLATAERNALATMGLKSGLPAASPPVPDTELAERWKTLERSVDEWRLRSESLQTQVADLTARNLLLSSQPVTAPSAPAPRPEPAPLIVPTPSPLAGVPLDRVEALLKARRDSVGSVPPTPLDEVRTKLLVRAILRSPEIRALYPDLLAGFDKYTEALGQRESMRGEREAYDQAIKELGQLKSE